MLIQPEPYTHHQSFVKYAIIYSQYFLVFPTQMTYHLRDVQKNQNLDYWLKTRPKDLIKKQLS